ncbi:anoctamin-3-like isoform X3 [Danaus plexippus]|uniref:anoctamin-3-like isoform X3 n=1 Tax=Danaus plexippus TaxID=13037 RepID=UPI002AB15445|nr:anoctamin-3-like isoform X3 [Danaus plexippus]
MWHYPRWKRLQETDKRRKLYKDHEYTYMAEMAFVHAILTIVVKEVFIVLALLMTNFENYKTFIKHEISISIKLFFFCFMNSYTVFVIFSYLGVFFFKNYWESLNDYMGPFGRMSNNYSSSLDEICLSVVVMTILEHVIFRLFDLFKSHQTDYSFFCKNAPCWEREYKLKPITENFFHKGYHKLLMQFALLTCYSMLFPLASLCILIINLWDLRQTAYELLLTHRRPLLINNSGPGFWKILFLITAHIAPYFNEKEYQEMETYLRQTTCFHPYFCNKNIPIQQDELGIRYVILVMVLGVVLDFFLRFIIPATSESLEEKIRKENRIKDKYLIRKGIAN